MLIDDLLDMQQQEWPGNEDYVLEIHQPQVQLGESYRRIVMRRWGRMPSQELG